MPTYQIGVVNEHFTASDEHDSDNLEAVWKQALKGAIAIASEQVTGGEPFFAAEVTIDEDSKRVARFVVSVGASRLKC